MYKQIKGKVMKNNAKSKFPYFRLVIGSILGTLLMHIKVNQYPLSDVDVS